MLLAATPLGDKPIFYLDFKKIGRGKFFLGAILPKIFINLPETYENIPCNLVRENHVSSAVSEILRYRQKSFNILLFNYKDNSLNTI